MSPRFGTGPSETNTGAVVNYNLDDQDYAAAITLTPDAFGAIFIPGDLTGNLALTIASDTAKTADSLTCIFTGSGSARTVTLSGTSVVDGTLVAADGKQATITLIFDGTNYVETSRFVQP